ncbi:MAG: hypothetical protein Q8P24_13235 [Desulfobacterales bacterium]|nr:hypothetical protein [Desulfobacterales bacterium]
MLPLVTQSVKRYFCFRVAASSNYFLLLCSDISTALLADRVRAENFNQKKGNHYGKGKKAANENSNITKRTGKNKASKAAIQKEVQVSFDSPGCRGSIAGLRELFFTSEGKTS